MMSSGDFAVYDDKDEKFVTFHFLSVKVYNHGKPQKEAQDTGTR